MDFTILMDLSIIYSKEAGLRFGTEQRNKTSGGLTKGHLVMNKHGRIVSKKKHATAKKEKRLQKHGYTAKKGKFGAVKISSTGKGTKRRRSRRRRR